MAYPGPSIGPWQIPFTGKWLEDMVVINEVFRQIEEQIGILRGLRNEIGNFSIAAHSHGSSSGGGTISMDHGALTGLTDDDHTQYLLASQATSRAAFTTNWTDLTDGGDTTLHTHAGGSGGGISSADGTTLDEAVGDVGAPFDRIHIRHDTMESYDLASMDALQLKALQLITVGDDLVTEVQVLSDSAGNPIYA